MAQPEADYEIDLDDDEREMQREFARVQAQQEAAQAREKAAAAAKVRAEQAKVDRQLAAVQLRGAVADAPELAEEPAVAEGVVTPPDDESATVEFLGEKFRVADKVGLMPLLKFASASSMSTDDPRALAAVYEMLRDCIHPGTPGCGTCADCKADRETDCKTYDKGDWQAFENHATKTKADADELLDVITKVMVIISGRPTTQAAGSSAGRRATQRGLTASSSGRRGKGSRR